MQFQDMVLLGCPHRLWSICWSSKEERVHFLFVCVAPTPLISVLLLRCATVGFLELCPQPPQGGHVMKQPAEIRCDHRAWEHRQTSGSL